MAVAPAWVPLAGAGRLMGGGPLLVDAAGSWRPRDSEAPPETAGTMGAPPRWARIVSPTDPDGETGRPGRVPTDTETAGTGRGQGLSVRMPW